MGCDAVPDTACTRRAKVWSKRKERQQNSVFFDAYSRADAMEHVGLM